MGIKEGDELTLAKDFTDPDFKTFKKGTKVMIVEIDEIDGIPAYGFQPVNQLDERLVWCDEDIFYIPVVGKAYQYAILMTSPEALENLFVIKSFSTEFPAIYIPRFFDEYIVAKELASSMYNSNSYKIVPISKETYLGYLRNAVDQINQMINIMEI